MPQLRRIRIRNRAGASTASAMTIIVIVASLASVIMLLNNGIQASKEATIIISLVKSTTPDGPKTPPANDTSVGPDHPPDWRVPPLIDWDNSTSHVANVTLIVEASEGSGSNTPETGNHTYTRGTSVQAKATPSPNWVFSHWLLDDTNERSNPLTIVMDTTHKLKPVFQAILYTLTISVDGLGSINPASGTYKYINGTKVLLNATASKGWKFNYWTLDDKIWAENPTNVLITKNLKLSATFTPLVLPSSTSPPSPPPMTVAFTIQSPEGSDAASRPTGSHNTRAPGEY